MAWEASLILASLREHLLKPGGIEANPSKMTTRHVRDPQSITTTTT
jgi:hypothetical protein